MSSPSDRMLKLMAYADGELEGTERAEVEAWLASDAEAVRLLDQVANLGEVVKAGYAESPQGKAVASFNIADAVMAKVDAGAKPASSVSSLDEARRRRPKRNQMLKFGGGVAAALALAASVLMTTRTKQEEPMAWTPTSTVQPTPSPNAATAADPGVDVDLHEAPGQSVSVFYLPSDSTRSTSVVVWVDETGDKR